VHKYRVKKRSAKKNGLEESAQSFGACIEPGFETALRAIRQAAF
jgi:hypothetical protein